MSEDSLKKCSRCKKVGVSILLINGVAISACMHAGVVLLCAVSAVGMDTRKPQETVQALDHTNQLISRLFHRLDLMLIPELH